MGDNDQATLNQAASSPADSHIDTQNAQEDSEPILGTPIESAGLVSTTEFEVTDSDESAQEDGSQTPAKKGDPDDSSKSADEKLTADEMKKLDATFQDSPRFKELMEERTSLKAGQIKSDARVEALVEQVQTLATLVQGGNQNTQTQQNQKPAYSDILNLTDEQIIESFETDPKSFLANFAVQLESEITGKLTRQSQANHQQATAQTQEQAVKDLYTKYESDNPDFVEQWDNGSIQKYMDDNPGLTPIAAHKIMKAEGDLTNSSDAQKKAIDEAVAAALEKQRTDMAT